MTLTTLKPNLINDLEATMENAFSVAEVAERLGVTPRTVVRWIREKIAFPNAYQKNPFIKTSPFVVPLADLEDFEQKRRTGG